jgi:hypothetical protein
MIEWTPMGLFTEDFCQYGPGYFLKKYYFVKITISGLNPSNNLKPHQLLKSSFPHDPLKIVTGS